MQHKFQVGNVFGKGRRGAKNRIATRVLEDLRQVWDEPATEGSSITLGIAALRVMARTHPADFAKLYANIVPKEFWVENGTLTDMTDDEVETVIARLRDEVRQEQEGPGVH